MISAFQTYLHPHLCCVKHLDRYNCIGSLLRRDSLSSPKEPCYTPSLGGTCWSVFRSPWDAFLKQPVAFATPQQSFQPSLLQQSQQGAFLSAQTLPLNNSQTVEQVLAVVEHPRFVSTVVIKPDLIPRSPPPPPEVTFSSFCSLVVNKLLTINSAAYMRRGGGVSGSDHYAWF